ncbi:putative ester cyclase [Streptomyces achromogenes]|uniref:ester cyclase n=1 Tax=Streptomyces achromogenes TaxID=67255 RepID=UPI00277F7EA7|nr:nuclear transport factor 2 family protein [Streptomyces achromogenes]MDQ0828235.1 putative ester cyclase [Streptomyces achromogenes]
MLFENADEAFNARDLSAATTIFSADFVSHPLGTVGVDSVVKAWSGLHASFPDMQVIVEDMLVEADRAAVRTSLHGIPAEAEGQALPLPSMMEIFRVRDGRIAELWGPFFTLPPRTDELSAQPSLGVWAEWAMGPGNVNGP